MLNLQDYIASNPSFRKMAVDDLLFVEYKCPLEEGDLEVWWHNNFFEFVLTGSITLTTLSASYTLNSGDCIFAKKGSVIASSHRQANFCELLVFVPDHFIRSVIHRYSLETGPIVQTDTIVPLPADEVLQLYFHSLLVHFQQPEPPSDILLRLKFEELIVQMLSGKNYLPVKSYFSELCASAKPSIRDIMEANFSRNLSLEELARLCARSLSTFKEEFKTIYHTTPGKWLLERRLTYSRYLLTHTDKNLDAVCMASGFENVSHFIRIFKDKFGMPPGKFKEANKLV